MILILLYAGDKRRITGVTTQGKAHHQRVRSYTIAHGNDPSQFQMYREPIVQDKVIIWRALDDAPSLSYVNVRPQESYGSCNEPKVVQGEVEQPHGISYTSYLLRGTWRAFCTFIQDVQGRGKMLRK